MLNSQAITRGKLSPTLFLILALFLLAIVFSIAVFTRRATLSTLDHTAGERMRLYQGTLFSALEKYRYLPYFISRDDTVLDLFSNSSGPARTRLVNLMLARARQKSGCAALFIMDDQGKTLCDSNWDSPSSFVGHHYGFRPYFKDAMAGNEGRFYAIGATTGTPGYFMSHPIIDPGGTTQERIKGVVVVKVDLSGLENGWRDKDEELKKTLFSVSQITDRMEAITRQLKNFSRKSPLKVEPAAITFMAFATLGFIFLG